MISCFKGKFKVTSPRGYRTLFGQKQYHGGLDLVALEDKNIYAIADGKVDATPYEKDGFGYYVRQKLDDGRRIYYGHMLKDSVSVKAGQKIVKGQKIGVMGSSGSSTGAHTHLEIRVPGTSFESLDISEYTGIPNKTGTYECREKTFDEAVKLVKERCGFEDKTIDYLKEYKYAAALFSKLAAAMER